MFNLINPRQQRQKRQIQIAAFEFLLTVLVTFTVAIIWWTEFDSAAPPAAPVNTSPPVLPHHPINRHIAVWEALATDLPSDVEISAVEFADNRWLIHLLAPEPTFAADWSTTLRERSGIALSIQQTQPHEGRFRFTFEVRLPS